ncbi:hypothetical protein FLA_4561 [Filimonas lacunae]|nr:hypothetical protein FLA_4561 [Filimonas lacunae]
MLPNVQTALLQTKNFLKKRGKNLVFIKQKAKRTLGSCRLSPSVLYMNFI